MTDRISSLIKHLNFTNFSLSRACANLGFSESELTKDELNALYANLSRCVICQCWKPESYFEDEVCYECGDPGEEY